ncbi:MAG: hypothetical protein WC560_05195 [Syntrophales bacterium]
MKKYFPRFSFFFILIVALTGCAQTKQYTPQPIGTQYSLAGMPADLVRVQVNDLRAEKENSDELIQAIKGQILSALSPEKIIGNRSLYNLHIDIIEHRSFFTLGNWNASMKLRIKLIDPKSNIIGNWNAEGNAHLSNMWGYATAKAVSRRIFRGHNTYYY